MGILRLHRTIRVAQLIESAGQDEQGLAVRAQRCYLRAIHCTIRIIRQVHGQGLKYGTRRRIRSDGGAGWKRHRLGANCGRGKYQSGGG